MNTTRTKRWNGKIETLAPDYLKDVTVQMVAYGDRVKFALTRGGQRPHYQVTNASDKKMAFDSNHHLFNAQPEDFVGSNSTNFFTLDQIKAIMAGGSSIKKAPGTRVSRVGSNGPSAVVKMKDLVAAEKYEYFKNNRQTMPPEIGQHSDEITQLMQNGLSAADAFNQVIERHF